MDVFYKLQVDLLCWGWSVGCFDNQYFSLYFLLAFLAVLYLWFLNIFKVLKENEFLRYVYQNISLLIKNTTEMKKFSVKKICKHGITDKINAKKSKFFCSITHVRRKGVEVWKVLVCDLHISIAKETKERQIKHYKK